MVVVCLRAQVALICILYVNASHLRDTQPMKLCEPWNAFGVAHTSAAIADLPSLAPPHLLPEQTTRCLRCE